jgi:hypothetical protein
MAGFPSGLGPVYPATHMIFLTIESVLFMPGNMTVMSVGHSSFFPTDLMVSVMHPVGLASGDIAIPALPIDPAVLIVQPVVHFSAAGMVFVKVSILSH